nr:hypothetical protein GCM10020093_063290 [Planobispora longispora]
MRPAGQRCLPLYVAHPPLGKWMIGAGEQFFGANPFGWRVAVAVAGVASILILARVARRMTRSTLLGCLAGLLLALDGLHFVLSRTALLDGLLAFWVLAGFACLVVDRDHMRSKLVDWYESSPLSEQGPGLGARPWRLAAGACLGAACAVKWSGIFFLLAFAVMSLVWDAGARRAIGLRRPYTGAVNRDATTALSGMVLVPAAVYVASWAAGSPLRWAGGATGSRPPRRGRSTSSSTRCGRGWPTTSRSWTSTAACRLRTTTSRSRGSGRCCCARCPSTGTPRRAGAAPPGARRRFSGSARRSSGTARSPRSSS